MQQHDHRTHHNGPERHDHTHRGHQHRPANHGAHDTHAGHSVGSFKRKFWVSLLLTIPVLAYSPMMQQWFGFTPPTFVFSDYLPFVLGSGIFFYGGWVFLQGAVRELKDKKLGMMTLISLAITAAYTYSVATQFFTEGESFFWELATLVTIMLLGHWVEMAAIAKATDALSAFKQLLPDTAEKLVEGAPKHVAVAELVVGDRVLVRPGGRIPADGVIVQGTSSVDEAAITGESKPVPKTVQEHVIAGTINQEGALTITITGVGEHTALAGIMRLVADAQASKSHTQVLADKAAFFLTFVALGAAVITFVLWVSLGGDIGFALERAVTVLIIACPHALGLAIPLVVSIASTRAAQNGLLIRNRHALESARSLDTVLFDKTGTLTSGEHGVIGLWAAKGYQKDTILALTASLEQQSEHIIAAGISRYAKQQKVQLVPIDTFSALPGLGVQGTLAGYGTLVAAGSPYVREHKLAVPSQIAKPMQQAVRAGASEVYLVQHGAVIGALALADQIRPESAIAVRRLTELGIKTAIVTGDSQAVARHVARAVSITDCFAEVRPEGKASVVQSLQATGQRVAMVGDGINDAPALTQADIGLAIGSGTDVAVTSADVILARNDPQSVVKMIVLSRATYRKMLQNLVWAAGYNIFAIPLAAGALYGFDIILSPAVGAVLMSVSTIVVALNAQLLRRVKLT